MNETARAIKNKDLPVKIHVRTSVTTGHSWRWCETCRLFVEWLRWAKTEPQGLSAFLWDRFRMHRKTGR